MPKVSSSSLRNPSPTSSAPYLIPNFPTYQVTNFAMHSSTAATLSNNAWFKLMVPWTLHPLIGVNTTPIGVAIAVRSESPSMLPTNSRPRPADRLDWLNPYAMALHPSIHPRLPMTLALTPPSLLLLSHIPLCLHPLFLTTRPAYILHCPTPHPNPDPFLRLIFYRHLPR